MVGARPGHVLALIMGGAILVRLVDSGLGILPIYVIFLLGQDWIAHALGLCIDLNPFTLSLVYIVLMIALFGCLIDLVPGIRRYRYSLIDGVTVRI